DARASENAQRIVDAFTAAASDAECDLDTQLEQQFRAYSLARASEPVALAAAALEARGIEPQFISTGGGSDAHVFNARGFPCVNVAALDLGLGSGGFDIVHVNLTRGLDSDGRPGANVMKLNYTSLQHAVVPVGGGVSPLREGSNPVAVLALHGQLPCVAWAAA